MTLYCSAQIYYFDNIFSYIKLIWPISDPYDIPK